MQRVFLVNPSVTTLGYGIIAPRWLFVIAQATPKDLVGDPIIIDESLGRFDPSIVQPGDVVGIGITTGNCASGYRILKEVKDRGATAIMGGIHATIFPDEPLEFGADSVITGNGDLAWPQAIKDSLADKLQKKYIGGRVPGDQLIQAKWDLMDPRKYLSASVQTIAGCPENCSFCSVWVTDGRKVRQRLSEKIIYEVNQLYSMGLRYILFADDNFNPATLGRIEREPSQQKRKELEKVREDRLRFFEEYDRSVPKDIYGFTQMTSEIASDPEYLDAMYEKMRIRGVLLGVESFSEDGLKSANKSWNPVGAKMAETIQLIQDRGIVVLSSMICGLESDTVESIESMRNFAINSGTNLAQFIIYSPYPGSSDFLEMTGSTNLLRPKKKSISIRYEKFWLDLEKPAVLFNHPSLDEATIVNGVRKSWESFYSIRMILSRAKLLKRWSRQEKLWYIFASILFKYVYAKDGVSADYVRSQRMTKIPALLIKIGVSIFNFWIQRKPATMLMDKPT